MGTVATVKLGTNGISDVALLEKGRNHVTMTTGNPAFTDPDPKLVDITKACDDLEISIQEVLMGGGKLAFSVKRTRIKTLKDLLKEFGGYVQATSGGDRDLILSVGFECRRDAQPVDQLDMPLDLRTVLTNFTGQVPLRWKPVKDATNYQVFMNSTDPAVEAGWQQLAFTSQSRYTAEGLDSVKHYWFRVQAIGRKGLLSPMSEMIKALTS